MYPLTKLFPNSRDWWGSRLLPVPPVSDPFYPIPSDCLFPTLGSLSQSQTPSPALLNLFPSSISLQLDPSSRLLILYQFSPEPHALLCPVPSSSTHLFVQSTPISPPLGTLQTCFPFLPCCFPWSWCPSHFPCPGGPSPLSPSPHWNCSHPAKWLPCFHCPASPRFFTPTLALPSFLFPSTPCLGLVSKFQSFITWPNLGKLWGWQEACPWLRD